MPKTLDLRVRRSVHALQSEYDKGNKLALENLVRAWRGIQALPPENKRSFFALGGFHGEPFQYRPAVDALLPTDTYTYWGGWCNHGNVLFPTWHRVYLLKLEDALRSIVPDVALPFWDETSPETLRGGIPAILTQPTFELDGQTIPNPLRSFKLPQALNDDLAGDDKAYAKPAGYETVRYPLSGLVGTPAAVAASAAHNAQFPNAVENDALLNQNVRAWLKGSKPTSKNPDPDTHGVAALFQQCLDAPNYTVFSNKTSSSDWNVDHPGVVVALEEPHNDIHLAVGGFDLPGEGESGQLAGANGDMGENNTAGLDPIFYFHHCNVDRMFWLWQKRHGFKDALTVIPNYPGTSSSDSQGPTPGVAPGTPLDMASPLLPFMKDIFGNPFTSLDCVNIETQLGYSYGPGSLDKTPVLDLPGGIATAKKLTVRGIDRALFEGSFVVRATAIVKDAQGKARKVALGSQSVLSRRNVVACANCMTHQEVILHFSLAAIPAAQRDQAEFQIAIRHRGSSRARASVAAPGPAPLPAKLKFSIEVVA